MTRTKVGSFGGMSPGLLAVQIIIGYEFLLSGLTKVKSGEFVDGFAKDLRETSADAPGWYRSFLDDVVLPNDTLFAWLTQLGELAIGATLIGGALALLLIPKRLGSRGAMLALIATAGAAFGAALLTINAHYATAGPSPIGIGGDPFDEAVDLDSLMTAIEVVLGVVALRAAQGIRSRLADDREEAEPGSERAGPAEHV